jgi:hypothetical protein
MTVKAPLRRMEGPVPDDCLPTRDVAGAKLKAVRLRVGERDEGGSRTREMPSALGSGLHDVTQRRIRDGAAGQVEQQTHALLLALALARAGLVVNRYAPNYAC